MPSKHALLAPSAAKRWMTCAPSALLESKIPVKDTSYTIEGTIAHAVGEFLLHYYYDGNLSAVSSTDSFVQTALNVLSQPKVLPEWGPLWGLKVEAEDMGFDFKDILTTVHEGYVRVVYEDYLTAREQFGEAQLLVEAELRLDDYIPEGFGSSDAVIIAGDHLGVYDLKYGKGVKVDAQENPQMMCYALGALLGPGELSPISVVRMTIIQPRLDHVSHYVMTYDELMYWANEVLKPKAEAAFAGWGSFQPGSHCKFCRAAFGCTALKMYNENLMEQNAEPELMDTTQLAEVLSKLDTFRAWIMSVEENALSRATAGESIPGWKLIEGRSIRKISDPDGVVATLREAGFQDCDIFKPKEVRTITELERLVGKRNFPAMLGSYVVKPQGKPTLAPESDPHPAINTAELDFANQI